ncbi:hypothetical protein VTO42DRAFT_4637 [Malbranchea cinnamomea]
MDSHNTTTSGRNLKTYGKASRTVSYTKLRQASLGRASGLFASDGSGAVVAEKARARATQDQTKPTSFSAKPPPSTPSRTLAKKLDRDIFEFPSSEDELQGDAARRQKRRKLSAAPVLSGLKCGEGIAPSPRRPGNVTPPRRPMPARPESRRNQKTPLEKEDQLSGVGVAIKTPPKATQMSNPVQEQQSTGVRTLRKEMSQVKLGGETKTPKLIEVDATGKERPIRPHISGSPAGKLRSMTRHLSSFLLTTSRPDQSPDKSLHGFRLAQPNGSTPGTARRTRLVDALGIKRRYTGDPSDTDDGDRHSRSLSPSERSLHSESGTYELVQQPGLANPRRAPASSQRVTYARQRSFLTDKSRDDGSGEIDPLGDLHTPLISEKPQPLLRFQSSTSFEFNEEDQGDTSRTIRSVYELRHAGSNARYQGVIETIFEDLEDETTSLSCRRSGLIHLCFKLGDYQFAHKFLSNSLDKRLAKCTSCLSDVICSFILACIYALILSTSPTSPIVLRTCNVEISRLAPTLLRETRDIIDIAKQKDSKLTKAGYIALKELREKMRTSKIWAEQKPESLSLQLLALRCTELAVRRIRETGNSIESLTLPVFKQLVDILQQPFLTENANSDDLLIFELVLSILESYTVGHGQFEPRKEAILRELSKPGILLSDLTTRQFNPCSYSRRRVIQGLEIRLLLNITNNNSRLCEDFSTPELVRALAGIVWRNFGSVSEELVLAGNGSNDNKGEPLLDTVILALGALINLMEWSGKARRLVKELQTDGTSSVTVLDEFIRLFSERWESVSKAKSVAETHFNVVFGYLSVLLSTLALDDEVRSHMRATLAGPGLARLLSTVEEFLHYHRKVEEEIRDAEREEEDAMVGFTARLQSIVDRIRQAERVNGR